MIQSLERYVLFNEYMHWASKNLSIFWMLTKNYGRCLHDTITRFFQTNKVLIVFLGCVSLEDELKTKTGLKKL